MPFQASIPSLSSRGLACPRQGEPGRHALEQLQLVFIPKRRSSSSFISSGGLRHFAALCKSLRSLALGPPASSVPGHNPRGGQVSPRTLRASETCCWSGSYSILCSRNVSVPPKKLLVRFCDDSGPEVTTSLSSCAPCNRLSVCFRPSGRSTRKNRHRAPGCSCASLHGRNGTEKPRLGSILPPPNLGVMFTPPLSSIQ